MPRIVGRKIFPTDPAESHVLAQLGAGVCLRIPRRLNPYAMARVINRIAHHGADVQRLSALRLQLAGTAPREAAENFSAARRPHEPGAPDEEADDAA